jgi:hypothetical protein
MRVGFFRGGYKDVDHHIKFRMSDCSSSVSSLLWEVSDDDADRRTDRYALPRQSPLWRFVLF